MKQLSMNLKNCNYQVIITQGYQDLMEKISPIMNARVFVITDSRINELQFESLAKVLEAKTKVIKYVIEEGESSKSLETAEKIYRLLMKHRARKNDIIIAFGGGVIGDITGFVSSTYLRGIPFIQIPTTLLAQIDSSMGGKTAVDYNGVKNIIGTFYHPYLVYINMLVLHTLSIEEKRCGMAEAIVHSIIGDESLFNLININYQAILHDNGGDILEQFISMNCAIKIAIVEADEKEKSGRELLNLGHTIGHAIESSSNYELKHGECVSLGLLGAFYLANDLGYVELITVKKVYELVKKIGLPYYYPDLELEKVMDRIRYDKKIKESSSITFIMPKQIGEVEICQLTDWETKISIVLEKLKEPMVS